MRFKGEIRIPYIVFYWKFYFFLMVRMCEFSTVKPVNKGHPREIQRMVFIDKWSLFGGYLFYFILPRTNN